MYCKNDVLNNIFLDFDENDGWDFVPRPTSNFLDEGGGLTLCGCGMSFRDCVVPKECPNCGQTDDFYLA